MIMSGKNDTIRSIFNVVTILIFIEFVLGGLDTYLGFLLERGYLLLEYFFQYI